MSEIVYSLCAATSILCALMLLRQYLRSRTSILFWSSLCFGGLAINNILLVVDMLIWPTGDLRFARSLSAVCALLPLVFGLIWSGVSDE